MVFEPVNFMFSRADWVAGGYLEGSVVTHGGTLYHADMQTTEEPGIGVEWSVLVTFPRIYESIPLAANVPITESGGPVQITTLAISPAEVGRYRISFGIVADFTSAGDRLTWRILGTFASASDFIIESKDSLENISVYQSFTRDVTGPFTITIEAEIIGLGNADVEISVADIYMTRIA